MLVLPGALPPRLACEQMSQQLPRRVFQDQMRRQNKTSPCTLQEWVTALRRACCWSRGDGESPGWVLQLAAAAAAGVDAEKGARLPSRLWGLLGLMTKICWWLESEGGGGLVAEALISLQTPWGGSSLGGSTHPGCCLSGACGRHRSCVPVRLPVKPAPRAQEPLILALSAALQE